VTILFASGEDTGFISTGAGVGVRASSEYRTTFARCSLWASNAAAADPPANRWTTPAFAASSDVWLHATVWTASVAQTNNSQCVLVYSPDGVARILLRTTATSGQLKVSKQTAAGVKTDLFTASSNLSAATFTQLDLHIDYTVSGGVELFYNGVSVGSASGDPRTDSATQLDHFAYSGISNDAATASVSQWSEWITADEDTTAMSLWTLPPAAAGNTQSWTPNTLASINKTVINDTTSISTATNNALSQWTTPVTPPSGAWNVKAIVQEARLQRGSTGPQHADFSLRTAGTDFVAGLSLAPSLAFGNFGNQIWSANPNTSADWQITDIAAGFNLGIKALA
jgi:hypothetical protein